MRASMCFLCVRPSLCVVLQPWGKLPHTRLAQVFPAATRARDMDGQLPLDYGLRNTSSALYEIVSGLLTVNPHCLRVEGGTAKVLSDWERVVQDEMLPSLVQCLLHSCPDSCNKTVNLTPAWPQQQLRCLNKLQRQALQVAGEGGSGSGEAADVLGAFMRRLQDCVTQTQAEEGARGELVTDMLADDERQAMFRVLAFEFFKSTGVSEHSHTAGAGAAARARMEREDASAAAAEAAEPAGEGGEAVVGTPMRSDRFPAGEVGAGDGEELGVAGVSKMRIMSRVSSLFSRHGGGVVEESGNPEEREKRPAGAGGFSPGRTTFDGSVGESEPSSTSARKIFPPVPTARIDTTDNGPQSVQGCSPNGSLLAFTHPTTYTRNRVRIFIYAGNVMSMGSSFVMAAAAAAKFTVKSSRKVGLYVCAVCGRCPEFAIHNTSLQPLLGCLALLSRLRMTALCSETGSFLGVRHSSGGMRPWILAVPVSKASARAPSIPLTLRARRRQTGGANGIRHRGQKRPCFNRERTAAMCLNRHCIA